MNTDEKRAVITSFIEWLDKHPLQFCIANPGYAGELLEGAFTEETLEQFLAESEA